MRKRPTAKDRALADVFRRMKPGKYTIDVIDETLTIRYLGLAKLKQEGMISISLEDKTIDIVPVGS